MTISLDGTGSTYEYVRYPAKHDTVWQNVKRYREELDKMPNSKLQITFVLQLWNLHDSINSIKMYAPLADWFIIEPLNDPKFMEWHMSPEHIYKRVVLDLYSELQKGHDEKIDTVLKRFSEIIKNKQPADEQQWQQLRKFVSAQDGLRKIDVSDYIPILASELR